MRVQTLSLATAVALGVSSIAYAADEGVDDEMAAWSRAYSASIDVSHNIACPALKPRIDMLTQRLGDVQDIFVARHPAYVFPPMIFAKTPFVGCDDGQRLVAEAEARATRIEKMVEQR